MAVVEPLEQVPPRLLGRRNHGLGLGRVHRKGLLAEHVLAGAEGRDRPARMFGGRQAVIDQIDGRIGQQRLVSLVGMGDLVLFGIVGGDARAARCHRVHHHVIPPAHRLDDRLRRNARSSQYPDRNHPSAPRKCIPRPET